MSGLTISISLTGQDEVGQAVQALRSALSRRGPLHSHMAKRGQTFTQEHLRSLNRHSTAARLGAAASGHYEKAANLTENKSDEDQALVTIPRSTGLGRAFASRVIRPGSGRTYLTIPAHAKTYGRSVRDFAANAFGFAMMGRFRALLWADGPDQGQVAYWLKREVHQSQDRSLLPVDAEYASVAKNAAVEYLIGLDQKNLA